MKIGTTAQLREMDRQAIEDYEIPGLILMENAALGVVDVLQERFGPLQGKRIAIVCGHGNNGGDGLAIARHLAVRHKATIMILLSELGKAFTGDSLTNYKMADNYELPFYPSKDFDFSKCDLIVDALFGTGFKGVVNDEVGNLIENMNKSGKQIISVDVPSGLDSDSGAADGCVVNAAITVTSSLAKYGQLVYPGVKYVGELIVKGIGIPDVIVNASDINTYATEMKDIGTWLPIRKNDRDTNKGSFGHVVVFAGSPGFVGAAIIVAEAAERSGAGLVTLAAPEDIIQLVLSRLSPVVMTSTLPNLHHPSFEPHAIDTAISLMSNATSVALGPGLGLDDEMSNFVLAIVAKCPVPLVIDADALTILAKLPDRGQSIVKNRRAATILTPHPGEMARLLGVETADIQSDRKAAIKKAVDLYECVVLLKGARTLTADSSGNTYINLSGNPGMSTGGAGDALTGIIAGLLAQRLDALPAAAAGAYVHGHAGDIVKNENGGTVGTNATDLISHLPKSIACCQCEV